MPNKRKQNLDMTPAKGCDIFPIKDENHIEEGITYFWPITHTKCLVLSVMHNGELTACIEKED